MATAEHKPTMERAKVRGKPGEEAPFGWYSQAALHAIAELYNLPRAILTARSIYIALTELCNERGNRFQASQTTIANQAGMETPRKIGGYLKEFEKAALVKIDKPDGERAKWTYTLLSIRPKVLGTKFLRTSNTHSGSQRYIEKNLKKRNSREGVVKCS
jgi:hypothetical protein